MFYHEKRTATVILAVISIFGVAAMGNAQEKNIPNKERNGVPFIYANSPKLGAYDPQKMLNDEKAISVDNYFMSLGDYSKRQLLSYGQYSKERNREILFTLEPRSWSHKDKDLINEKNIYQRIMAGRYDRKIKSICADLGSLSVPVTVRWAQEMEDPKGPYQWNRWSGEQYKNVYRRFVSQCQVVGRNIKYMWSPKGSIGKEAAYYPGDDVVDVVGVTLFGLQDYDKKYYDRDRGFEETFTPTYESVKKYNKPIWIAEFAYNGSAEYVERWQKDSLLYREKFPDLKAVVYFNAPEGTSWPDGWKPNWSLGSNIVLSR